jgi:non-ribosomal peptide synthetase component F
MMFNSGDIARWREDGSLSMLGRKEDQIKIRVSLSVLRLCTSKNIGSSFQFWDLLT